MDPAEFQLGKTKVFVKTPESVILKSITFNNEFNNVGK
jgi:hypothetical protein